MNRRSLFTCLAGLAITPLTFIKKVFPCKKAFVIDTDNIKDEDRPKFELIWSLTTCYPKNFKNYKKEHGKLTFPDGDTIPFIPIHLGGNTRQEFKNSMCESLDQIFDCVKFPKDQS